MNTRKSDANWNWPCRQTRTVDGYRAELAQVRSTRVLPGTMEPTEWPAGMARVEIDTQRHEFWLTVTDHPTSVLRMRGEVARVLSRCRLGLLSPSADRTDFDAVVRPFPAGASLVLVSQSVLDAGLVTRGKVFGIERLLRAINSASSASRVVSRILTALNQYLGGMAPEDDLTVVVITRTLAASSVETAELDQAA